MHIIPIGAAGKVGAFVFVYLASAEFAPDHAVGIEDRRFITVLVNVRTRFNLAH